MSRVITDVIADAITKAVKKGMLRTRTHHEADACVHVQEIAKIIVEELKQWLEC